MYTCNRFSYSNGLGNIDVKLSMTLTQAFGDGRFNINYPKSGYHSEIHAHQNQKGDQKPDENKTFN